jgi:nucleoside phosphorylase
MGLTATAILATQMILLYRPTVVIMVGIAAGTKKQGRGLGDILVADPSVDYASGKFAFVDGTEIFQPDPFPLPIDSRIRTLLQEDARIRCELDTITTGWRGAKPGTPLNVHIGPLGAADQVVDSAARVAEVQRNWRKLIGLEMETYAMYRAAHEAPRPRPLYVSFKSVCDFAADKDDSWQDYAAYTSAEYAKSFLLRHWDELSSIPDS